MFRFNILLTNWYYQFNFNSINDHMGKLKDVIVIQLLQSDKITKQDQALNFLYSEYYRMVEAMILKNSGTKEHVKDVFQDGVIVFYNMVRSEGFELKYKLSTLLCGICWKKWLMVLRKEKRIIPLENEYDFVSVAEDNFERIILTERKKLIVELLDKLNEECRKTLHLFYYERFRMSKIAKLLGLASEAVAKNKKSNCMKQLRKIVQGNPFYQQTLK